VPTWLVLNKIDRVDEAQRALLADRYPRALQLSAKSPADVAVLREKLIGELVGALEDAVLEVPYADYGLVHRIRERATILGETHHDDGTRLEVRAPASVIAELKAQLAN
jgi:GTP-binding protein HflX